MKMVKTVYVIRVEYPVPLDITLSASFSFNRIGSIFGVF